MANQHYGPESGLKTVVCFSDLWPSYKARGGVESESSACQLNCSDRFEMMSLPRALHIRSHNAEDLPMLQKDKPGSSFSIPPFISCKSDKSPMKQCHIVNGEIEAAFQIIDSVTLSGERDFGSASQVQPFSFSAYAVEPHWIDPSRLSSPYPAPSPSHRSPKSGALKSLLLPYATGDKFRTYFW